MFCCSFYTYYDDEMRIMNWKYSTVVHNANVKWCYIILAFTILIVLTNPSVSSADILDQFGFFDFPSIFCVVLSFPYLYILHIDPYSNLLNLSFEALISHPLSWCLLARKFHWKKQRISIRIGFISSFHPKKSLNFWLKNLLDCDLRTFIVARWLLTKEYF